MRGPLRPDLQMRRPNPPAVTEKEILDKVNPVVADDTEVYQGDAQYEMVMPVRMVGPVQTQAMPTVASGSRNLTIPATGTSLLAGSADPRRASLTIITNQPTYVSQSKAQCDLGVAALIPANVGVVITHRGEVYVAGATGNTYPMTVAVMSEQWAY